MLLLLIISDSVYFVFYNQYCGKIGKQLLRCLTILYPNLNNIKRYLNYHIKITDKLKTICKAFFFCLKIGVYFSLEFSILKLV